jgi:hypothetical protein
MAGRADYGYESRYEPEVIRHVVAPVVECVSTDLPGWCKHAAQAGTACNGCIGDGTRIRVVSARTVEDLEALHVVSDGERWRFLETWIEVPSSDSLDDLS